MDTLKHHIIFYDEDCPMCDLYTRAFIKTKMLDKNGRQPYGEAIGSFKSKINVERACDEIALINTKNGTVTYGIDSLFKILSYRFKWLSFIFRFPGFRQSMKFLYSFISYNRKVIIPGKSLETLYSCTPTFHAGYRIFYIILTWLLTSLILIGYSKLLTPYVLPGDFFREFVICGGQIIFQGMVIFSLKKQQVLHYLGNMMTISLAGAMLLMIAVMADQIITALHPLFYAGWFGLVVSLMLMEHQRRIRLLAIPWIASATWVLYRLLVLYFIL